MPIGRRGSLAAIASLALACGARSELDVPEIVPAPPCAETFVPRETPRCDPASSEPPPTIWPGASVLGVLTAGCDVVVVVTAGEEGRGLRVSTDGGATFAPLRTLPPDALVPTTGSPRFRPIAIADDGTLYVLARNDELALRVQRSDDLGLSWSAPVDVVEGSETWGASVSVAGERVAVYWIGEGVWLTRSLDGARTFEPPHRLGAGRLASRGYPTVCWAGDAHVAVSWIDCTASDCTGEDRDGIALGMTAIVSDEGAHVGERFRIDDGEHPPIVGCARDGRALAGWSVAPYLETDDFDLVVARLDACGAASETARFAGRTGMFFAPASPRPTLGESGALLTWRTGFDTGSGAAALDRSGALIDATLDPDYDSDARADLPIEACALPGGGYAMSVLGFHQARDPAPLLSVVVDDDGSAIDVRPIGSVHTVPVVAWSSCDARRRVHFVWRDDEGAHYAAIAAPRRP